MPKYANIEKQVKKKKKIYFELSQSAIARTLYTTTTDEYIIETKRIEANNEKSSRAIAPFGIWNINFLKYPSHRATPR